MCRYILYFRQYIYRRNLQRVNTAIDQTSAISDSKLTTVRILHMHSVESNPICGLEVWNFWRIWVSSYFGFGRRTWVWVWKGLKFSFSGFGLGLSSFLANQVQSLGFLEGFECVQSSVLVDEQPRVSLKFGLSS